MELREGMGLEVIREEIRFWRRLIGRWESAHLEPPPERMQQALAAAEGRLETALANAGREKSEGLFH